MSPNHSPWCFGQGRSDVTTPTTLEDWLARSGLSRLAAAFHANGIGLDIVRSLTDDDLKELGLSIGDRKRVLAAIAALEQAAPPPPTEGEQRQLTVLFCDLAGSTALAARLDPEDMRDLIRAYQSACAAAIACHDGFVSKFMATACWPISVIRRRTRMRPSAPCARLSTSRAASAA